VDALTRRLRRGAWTLPHGQERAALTRALPEDAALLWVVIDAAVSVTHRPTRDAGSHAIRSFITVHTAAFDSSCQPSPQT
jgi:hypothetical protein